jgi:hypothetical protein
MRKLAILAGSAALGLSGQAFGYEAVGTLTFSWGGNSGGLAAAESAYGTTADTSADIAWTSNGTSQLSVLSDSTYFSAQSGYNSRSWYNSDFAATAQCANDGSLVPTTATGPGTARKYGCRYTSYGGSPQFVGLPTSGHDPAAALTGASASGEISITDTTLTGTLTVLSASDEPTGAATTIIGGVRTSNSIGNGFSGFNLRSADGSPFGNSWNGFNTGATLTVNLTGTFTDSAWDITGGTVAFSDPGFACQQGGFGGTGVGTLCLPSGAGGGNNPNDGSHLSWGMDLDGASTGTTGFTEVNVRNAVGGSVIETLSGVLASLSVSTAGDTSTITATNSGEFRRALGSTGSGCADYIVWDGTRVSCGTLTTGRMAISGSVTVIPVPAAAWLVAPAILAAGRFARRRKTA